jgi:hypothetical protein
MKFYSEGYLKNVIHADPEQLKLPTRFDTLFVRKLSERANRYPQSLDSVFAATTPVRFKSRSPYITVEKVDPSQGELDDPSPADFYLKPEYNLAISGAFKAFNYSYVATIDDKGTIRVIKSLDPAENLGNRMKTIDLINKFYLERYLDIIPGTTLGIPHASKVVLNVKGY